MGQTRTDEAQLRVTIDGTSARKELAQLSQDSIVLRENQKKLQQQVAETKKELDKAAKAGDKEEIKRVNAEMRKYTDQLGESTRALAENEGRQKVLRKEIGVTALQYNELQKQAQSLRMQLKHTSEAADPKAYAELERQLFETEEQMKKLNSAALRGQRVWEVMRKEMKLSDMTMGDLRKESAYLNAELDKFHPNSAEFRRLRTELTAVDQRMATLRSGMGPFARGWDSIKSSVMGTVAGVTAVFAGGAILSGIKSWVTGSGELSDAQAEVQRTTGMTRAEVRALSTDLGQLKTRTARMELLELAKEAGKLGITGRDDVLAFVRAGDKLNVALGEELGEGAITAIGKLNQTFKVGEATGKSLEQQMLSTGSSITTLGNNSTASGAFLVDYSTRLAGVNVQAKISMQNTLGMAAALDQLGQRSETSSTAVSQTTLLMFKKTAEFAKVAKMELKDFQKLLNTDANEAFLRVLEGLRGNNAGLQQMTVHFKDMGEEGARAVGVLSSLANNTKLVREQQALANKSFDEGTSVMTAFDTKNSTLGANLDILGKRIHAAFVNSSIVDGINSIVAGLLRWTEVPLSEKLEEEALGIKKTYAEILSYNEGSIERTRLIRELQKEFPGFLENIDAETVSNQQLTLAVKELNAQMVNKIILQKKDEEIQDAIRQQAEQRMHVMEMEDDVRERMVQLAEKYNLKIAEGVPIQQQAVQVLQQIEDIQRRTGQQRLGRLFDTVTQYSHALAGLSSAQNMLNSMEEFGNKVTDEKTALMARLNMTFSNATKSAATFYDALKGDDPFGHDKKTGTGGSDAGPPMAMTDEERKEIAKHLESIQELLMKSHAELLEAGLTGDEKELQQLETKHRNELAELGEHQLELLRMNQLTSEMEQKQTAELLANQEIERDRILEAQAERRAKKAAEAAEKVAKAQRDAEDAVFDHRLSKEDKAITDEMRRMDALVAIYEAAGIDTQDVVRKTEQAILAIRRSFRRQEQADATKARKEQIQQQIVIYQGVGTAIAGVNGLLAAAYAASGKMNYEQTALGQQLGLAQIAIASGVGVAEAIKAGAGLVFPANLGAIASGVGAVLSGIANAIALLNSANIQQPQSTVPPQPAGVVQGYNVGEKGLLLDGPSHAEGGLDVIDPRTGRKVAEVEGKEAVVNKDVTAANPAVISELMAAAHRPDKRVDPARILPNDEVTRHPRAAADDDEVTRHPRVAADNEEVTRHPRSFSVGGLIRRVFMALGGAVGMEIPVKKQKNPGLTAGGHHQTHGTALVNLAPPSGGGSMQIPVKKQKNPGLTVGGGEDPDGPGTWSRMAAGGAVGMEIPVKKQKNPGLAAPGGPEGGSHRGGGHLTDAGDGSPLSMTARLLAYANGVNERAVRKRYDQGGTITSTSGGGVAGGSTHLDGGNDIVDTRTGKVLANMQRDELMVIMSQEATRANADLIPLLLEYSRKGQRLPILSSPVPPMDFAGAAQAMRVVHMAQGGAVGMEIPQKKQKNPGLANTGDDDTDSSMGELLDLLRDLRDNSALQLRKTDETTRAVATSRSVIFRPDRDYDRSLQVWQRLKDRNTAKRRRA